MISFDTSVHQIFFLSSGDLKTHTPYVFPKNVVSEMTTVDCGAISFCLGCSHPIFVVPTYDHDPHYDLTVLNFVYPRHICSRVFVLSLVFSFD